MLEEGIGMKIDDLRCLLGALDDKLEVRVSVEEYKENPLRDGTNVNGKSQSLVGVTIKGNILYLRGQKVEA